MYAVFSWKYETFFCVRFRLATSFSGLNEELDCELNARRGAFVRSKLYFVRNLEDEYIKMLGCK